MRAGTRPMGLAPALIAALVSALHGQGYSVRLDTRAQVVDVRGWRADSVDATAVVAGSGGGPATRDGFAVNCPAGSAWCYYFRPGARHESAPVVTTADATVWGFGIPGLSAHLNARLGGDAGNVDWPGTEPALQLIEGYADLVRGGVNVRAGRLLITSLLGWTGLDGGRLLVRDARRGLEGDGYFGWGLARGSLLPITAPALNPLDEFRPDRRQLVAGAGLGWISDRADLKAEWQREVDRRSRYLISERAAFSAALRPVARWSVVATAEYDLAQGWWGSADLSLAYAAPLVAATVTARRYRPHFDLWSIWPAFSPVAYRALDGTASVGPWRHVTLRARGERYRFEDAETLTPLVQVERDGWRGEIGATWAVNSRWTLDGAYHVEFGPGASSRGSDGSVTWTPRAGARVRLLGSVSTRPLEYRYDEAQLDLVGVSGDLDLADRASVSLSATRLFESRQRPDAAAFDWSQTRVAAGVTVRFGSGADRMPLPPAGRRGSAATQ